MGARGRSLVAVAGAWTAAAIVAAILCPSGALAAKPRLTLARAHAAASTRSVGELDCNGDSRIQRSLRPTMVCADIRGLSTVANANTWGGRFYDNGRYIGHDEPDMTFYSSLRGSGNDVTWTETLPTDPSLAPTVSTPGSDVTHMFELSPAPWFSMMLCDPNSYPQSPCRAESDANAPTCVGVQTVGCYPGGGSAAMEMQFYPPGFAPFADAISCDDTHWCSALTIDSLECTLGFATCNPDCTEPVNFAFIQTNGVPTGPPSPQDSNLATVTPNSHTLLMDPGDRITVHMFDAPVPGNRRARALEVVVDDLTTGQSGFMQASAANGFMSTSLSNCAGTPFNFQPEYETAKPANISPWAALQTNIGTAFETGHFEPCTGVSHPTTLSLGGGITDAYWNSCQGPYENAVARGDGPRKAEVNDSPCYPAGDTHGALSTAPDTVTGCLDFFAENGDLDFDGTSYWPDWPTAATPTSFPGSVMQSPPTTAGSQYAQFLIQTDVALSESSCSATTTIGCTVPPPGPGSFYPYWSRVTSGGSCTIEFGNVSSGSGVNDLGGDAQYGSDQSPTLGYPEFEGSPQTNTCT